MVTGARTDGEPSGAHQDHRAQARDTAGCLGRYTNTGHGADRQALAVLVAQRAVEMPQLQFMDRAVDTPVAQQRQVSTVQPLQGMLAIPLERFL